MTFLKRTQQKSKKETYFNASGNFDKDANFFLFSWDISVKKYTTAILSEKKCNLKAKTLTTYEKGCKYSAS